MAPPKNTSPSPLTVEHLWQCTRIGTPSTSPDGKWVVVDQSTYSMKNNESETQLWLYSVDGKIRKQLTTAGTKNTAPVWSPDGSLIAFCAQRLDDTASQIYVIAPDGGEARRVTALATGLSGVRWIPDSKRLIAISNVWPELKTEAEQAQRLKTNKASKVQAKVIEVDNYRHWDHWICDGARPHLFSVELRSGKCTDLFAGKPWTLSLTDAGTTDYAVSPDGKEIAWVQPNNPTRTTDPSTLMLLSLGSKRTRCLDLGKMWLASPCYSHKGDQLALLATPATAPSKHTRLMLVDRKTLKAKRVVANWPRSVGTYGSANPAFSFDDSAILFCAEASGQQHLYALFLDKNADDMPSILVHGGHIGAFSQSANGQTITYSHDSIDHPAQLIALDLNHTQAGIGDRRLDRCNSFLDKVPLGEWQSRIFSGWNKEDVQAFIAYPPNYDPKKKYPLLQNIHGGPHAAHMDTWHYRWNLHAFAAQGYIVAAVNYHGSSGFDEAFLGSIDGDLGHREMKDIEAVTDQLIKEGLVDKEKLFAAGGSYGGYMVAWLNGHTTRYKAYVCHAGVYNWLSQFGDDGYLWLKNELGAWPWEDLEKYQAQSPHAFAKNFKTPTLVIHGELDYRVPYYEGLEYYNTLRAKGISARLLVYPDENHWILKPQNSRLWYQEVFAWLKRFH